MAQNITLLGASYSDVPSILLPKTGGGTAQFDDTTIASNAASASDILSGKLAFVNGSLITGTGSGGGGGSNWTKIATQDFSVNTTSTSNASVGDITLPLGDYNQSNNIVWVHIRDKAGKRNGYFYGSDTIFFNFQLANNNTNSLSIRPVINFRVNSDGTYTGAVSAYGVYGYCLYYTSSKHYVTIYRRYNSSTTLTINGTFQCDVYVLTTPSGFTLFT